MIKTLCDYCHEEITYDNESANIWLETDKKNLSVAKHDYDFHKKCAYKFMEKIQDILDVNRQSYDYEQLKKKYNFIQPRHTQLKQENDSWKLSH
jgi:hypothetical protein